MNRTDLKRRAKEYAENRGLRLRTELGHGVHGSVFATESEANGGRSALKAFAGEVYYQRERDIYLRLQELGVYTLGGCNIPELLAYDDDRWILEMTIVARPFVLDFAGAYLDQAPAFSEDVVADWQAEKAEQFGSRWPEVQAILRELESLGIYMIDVNPGNISFGD